jgi:hypothetical protein
LWQIDEHGPETRVGFDAICFRRLDQTVKTSACIRTSDGVAEQETLAAMTYGRIAFSVRWLSIRDQPSSDKSAA